MTLKGVACLLAAFGGLLRDPIGSTEYWEIDRAVMRLTQQYNYTIVYILEGQKKLSPPRAPEH